MTTLFSPIVLFAYNRPFHTKQVLDSLAENEEAKESILYVFCDGAKENASQEVLNKIEQVRTIIKQENRFKEIKIIFQKKNKGLANSIIDGVTDVINKHGKIIVLEDDLVLSPFFLFYMNDSLNKYSNNEKVGAIGACNIFACGNKFPSSLFIPIPDCLGWATWKDRWDHFNADANHLLNELENKALMNKFNAYGSYNMEGMLKAQIGGNGTSWAVRWTAVCILKEWLTLYPNPAMTNHVESSDATHANINITPPLCLKKPVFETVPVEEIPEVIKAMKLAYAGTGDYFGKLKPKSNQRLFKKIVLKYLKIIKR